MNTYDMVLENQKNNFNYLIDSIDKDKLNELANILIEYKNENIFFAGVGKSGNISLHLSDLFKSIGFRAFNLNIMNITHGDIGCVKKGDLVIFFSKSGNTKEMLDIIDVFDCCRLLVCSNERSKISSKVDKTFIIPLGNEGDLKFDLIPSNSIVNNVIYFNFILNLVIDKLNLNLEDYKSNHPSGDIGFKTKKVSDFVSNDIHVCNNINISVKEVNDLLQLSKMGIVFNYNKKFYGIITTKDVLNCITSGNINDILSEPIKKYINRNPFVIENPESLISSKIDMIRKYKFFKFIPVIDDGKYIGIIDNGKILKYI